MIDRVHLFKLHDAETSTRDRLADGVRAALTGWTGRVGIPADAEAAKAWDLHVMVTHPADAVGLDEALETALREVRERSVVEKYWSFAVRD